MLPERSEIKPIPKGNTAPPTIMIMRSEDPWLVYSFKPAIESVKILDHIIELNNPIAGMHQRAIWPSKTKAATRRRIMIPEKKLNISRVEFLKMSIKRNCNAIKGSTRENSFKVNQYAFPNRSKLKLTWLSRKLPLIVMNNIRSK